MGLNPGVVRTVPGHRHGDGEEPGVKAGSVLLNVFKHGGFSIEMRCFTPKQNFSSLSWENRREGFFLYLFDGFEYVNTLLVEDVSLLVLIIQVTGLLTAF